MKKASQPRAYRARVGKSSDNFRPIFYVLVLIKTKKSHKPGVREHIRSKRTRELKIFNAHK